MNCIKLYSHKSCQKVLDELAFGNVKSIGRRDMPLPWSEEVKDMLKVL